ncbi:MAG: TatD family hydrolase [Deltaproteobacteria bacterium]|jgi:TatD DNase family protein|nr:TatD family hydrolase [Deltaproteobacteria bacterium]
MTTPPPAPLTAPLFDAHCHLFDEAYAHDLPEVMTRAKEAGVKTIVNSGLDAQSSQAALALAKEYPGLWTTVGWHPHEAAHCQKADLLTLEKLAQEPGVVALGEIGLDFFYLHSPADVQERLFQTLLDLASQLKLPVVIHTREAFALTRDILKESRKSLSQVLIHCFTGSPLEAQEWVDLDCHFSIPGVVTFPKAKELRESLPLIPLDRLLAETDGPYLAPVPKRGRRNEPAYLTHTVSALAAALGFTPNEMAALTAQNAQKFYGLMGV